MLFRDNISEMLEKNKKSIIYISSSNKNMDIYYDMLDNKKNVINLTDIEAENDYYKENFKLISNLRNKEKIVVLASLEGLYKKYFLEANKTILKIGDKKSRTELIDKLLKNNYGQSYLIEKRKEFSIRGDILDIFPENGSNPIRIEYFGNEIDRITHFDIINQKSYETIDEIEIYFKNENSKKIDFFEMINQILKFKELDIIIENIDIFKYKIEEFIITERNNEVYIRELYKNIENLATKIEVKRTDNDIKKINKTKRKVDEGIKYHNLSQIRDGDFVIHEHHGVGIYLGIEELNNKEYLAIKYADEDRLFVPIDGLAKIERYVVTNGKTPELYNLGRRGFKRKKARLEEEMLKFAKEIVDIQAKRSLELGYSFSKDTVWQEEFEENFPYIETLGQKNAIKDVKRDMESSKVMDRIVCGDVGYGKTEVAIRAAFKSVMDGKQVLMIAPTTVLAEQHFNRFIERYKNYPITINILSRLSSVSEQKYIIQNIASGGLDILIGTHKTLSKNIVFKDLGLIIVDEEQKFGVRDKEKLKKIKENVDMLTLTATPIPRTLNYALLGIRDISIIETAPNGRNLVETQVIDESKSMIKDIIIKELSREGQVFYIYNSINSMNIKYKELKNILPAFVEIDYIHGKMPPKDIKEKLEKFDKGNIDVLLSTTIIENGIDISNANTILIEGIDKLGLSQIYQLRGRVGRGNRKGYCYLIVDKQKKLGYKTMERKTTIKNIESIGGGFNLSLEDMKIRGAGEILGDKQHGNIETFGFNLYMKLLNEQIKKVKGHKIQEKEIKLEMMYRNTIPNNYIENEERLIIYRRLLNITNLNELETIKSEIKDRFGPIPKECLNLLEYLKIKILAKELKIQEIKQLENGYFIKFDNESIDFDRIFKLIQNGLAKYDKKKDGIYYFDDIYKFLSYYKGN